MAEHTLSTPDRGAVSVTDVGGGYVEVVYQNLAHYAKFIPALAAAALTTFVQISGHGNSLFIALSILVAILQAYATYQFSAGDRVLNSLKFWTNIIAVVLQGILVVVGSGGNLADITGVQWATIGLAALSALGVAVIPNGPQFKQQVLPIDPVAGAYSITGAQPPRDLQ